MSEKNYVVMWENKLTGTRGSGTPMCKTLADITVTYGNAERPAIYHWVERIPELHELLPDYKSDG